MCHDRENQFRKIERGNKLYKKAFASTEHLQIASTLILDLKKSSSEIKINFSK